MSTTIRKSSPTSRRRPKRSSQRASSPRAEARTDKVVNWWETKHFTFISGVGLLVLMFVLGVWAG